MHGNSILIFKVKGNRLFSQRCKLGVNKYDNYQETSALIFLAIIECLSKIGYKLRRYSRNKAFL